MYISLNVMFNLD